jgi:predicted dehydrogenase
MAQQWPAFDSLQAALEATHTSRALLDGLVVATPTPTHQAVIESAADAQIYVFTEKPVGGTAEEIRHLFAYAARAGIHVCCGFQRRWDPSYVSATQAVQAGKIGTPVAAQLFFADHPCPPKEFLLTGGNIFLDLAAHDVDYITQALQDEVVSVYASGTSADPELAAAGVHDHATMVMKFRRGKCRPHERHESVE